MAPIFGFTKGKNEMDIIKETENILNNEITRMNDIESQLYYQISEMEHLKKNLTALRTNFISIKKLSEIREKAVHTLQREAVKRNSEIDTAKCTDLLNAIDKIDKEFSPLIEQSIKISKSIAIEDTHILYEQESNRNKMKEINNEVEDMIAEIQLISIKHQSFTENMKKIIPMLSKIVSERQEKASKTNKIGF